MIPRYLRERLLAGFVLAMPLLATEDAADVG